MTFTFADLFAGIGGMRRGFDYAGGTCVFSSEWDRFAKETYYANFGEIPAGDITKIDEHSIPDHDILIGGFPCQPFSSAGIGKNKHLGRAHGFENVTQGTLFFDIARIVAAKRPTAFLLENVRNLVAHDNGKTWRTIRTTLSKELGYTVFAEIIDAVSFVPQHRERVYIVGFKNPVDFRFPDLSILPMRPTLADLLEKNVDPKYTLSSKLWEYLQTYASTHKERGHGFGYGLVNPENPSTITRTLSARYGRDGSEILLAQNNSNPRRLTPRECARLMGFPDTHKIVVSDTQAYKQFGNSVVVPVVSTLATTIVERL